MKKTEKQKNKGFTLIEFLIYSAIIAMFIGSLVLISTEIFKGNAHLATTQEVNSNMRFSFNRITHYIRRAESFDIIDGNSTLVLSLKDSEDSITFTLGGEEDNVLKIQENEEPPRSLINEDIIKATDLTFVDMSHSEGPPTIRTELTLKRKNPLNRPIYDFELTSFITENLRTY